MTTQPPDLKKLREVAERATPIYTDLLGDRYFNDDYSHATLNVQQDDFVSTFNPQTILALLDAYEASARDADLLEWLNGQYEAYGFEDYHEGNRWTIEGPFNSIHAAIHAARENDAARHATQGD